MSKQRIGRREFLQVATATAGTLWVAQVAGAPFVHAKAGNISHRRLPNLATSSLFYC
ncbi:MAG: hypothetical protein R3E79_36300 [Caldilineaceae bacterium]